MDDYLFIVMAKLKADRARLEREMLEGAGRGNRRGELRQPASQHSDRARWPLDESSKSAAWKLSAR